jgi:uncharacterized lipoprotein YddW (UPF0748 family)
MKLIHPLIFAASLIFCSAIGRAQPADAPPPAPREFRGAWVSSVGNGNWPSAPGLPVDQQKKEMIEILDRCAALHLNAIVLQVRPSADALYPSQLEPWSEYLTGRQGQAPSPMWDPLKTWIDECHKRGMEFHAWFNPYRVKVLSSKSPLAANSIANTHPEVVRKYGNYLWMDPGEPVAAQHTLAVILDIVRRYDVDGVHTDDYYYPYKIKDKAGNEVDFPDNASYGRYRASGGKLDRADWRRDNINQLVEHIYSEVHQLKPWVKVSYAPFGIWKSGTPPGITGMSQYDTLYADAKLWLNKGWLDFLGPQLYWDIGGPQDYVSLLKWWLSENTQHRYVWPGLSVARRDAQGTIAQIDWTRKLEPQGPGNLLWSVNSVIGKRPRQRDDNDDSNADQSPSSAAPQISAPSASPQSAPLGPPPPLYAALQNGPYAQAALIPAMPWLDNTPPPAPSASANRASNGAVTISLRPGQGEPTANYAIWMRYANNWFFTSVPGGAPSLTLNPDAAGDSPSSIVVTAVDRCGNESQRVTVPPPR